MSEEKLLKAEFGSPDHPLELGGLKIPAYVLEDGTRVLAQGQMIRSLDMSYGGAGKQRGDRLTKFAAGGSLKPFIKGDLLDRIANPIRFIPLSGGRAYGYEATILADLCEAVLSAREAGALQKQQLHIAQQCEILVRGFARVGIVALIDEVTGYQDYRDRRALREFLDKFITDEWAKWTKRFPDEFYEELFRLKRQPYPPKNMKRPSYVGHWTNDVVYKRLGPGVLQELRKENPRLSSGHRKRRFHQYLTRDIGDPALVEHLQKVIFLMRACTDWNDFYRRLNRVAPKFGDTIPLGLQEKVGALLPPAKVR